MSTTQSPEGHITVGRYLAVRLAQLGVHHVFGLPGDFNLTLLDEMLTVDGLEWVGTSNELNASYAADGYARVNRRMGALVTTHGVGELSAVNGIAGSYAEDVPVVHIVGMPSTTAMAHHALLHHTLLDGDFGRFVRIFREITVAQVVLTAQDAAAQIDEVLTAALDASKPVYLGIPLDLAAAEVSARGLETRLALAVSEPEAVHAFERALKDRLRREEQVVVLAGPRVHRRHVEPVVAALAELPGVYVASQAGSKAIVDERHPASLGTYLGAATRSPQVRDLVDQASLVVLAGTVRSDFTTGFFTERYTAADAIELAVDHARIGRAVYPDVRLEDSLAVLHRAVAEAGLPPVAPLELPGALAELVEETAPSQEPLDHAAFWAEVQRFVPPACTVVAETGTSFYGALDLRLPDRTDLLGQPVWCSIGYGLPATLGAALARPDRRPLLFIGDGAAQLTATELGTLFARGVAPAVFLLNNDGYTVERAIQSPDAAYQDIVAWRWQQLPSALGASAVTTLCIRTAAEARAVLSRVAAQPDRAFFVEVVLPRMDAPRMLLELARGVSASNAAGLTSV